MQTYSFVFWLACCLSKLSVRERRRTCSHDINHRIWWLTNIVNTSFILGVPGFREFIFSLQRKRLWCWRISHDFTGYAAGLTTATKASCRIFGNCSNCTGSCGIMLHAGTTCKFMSRIVLLQRGLGRRDWEAKSYLMGQGCCDARSYHRTFSSTHWLPFRKTACDWFTSWGQFLNRKSKGPHIVARNEKLHAGPDPMCRHRLAELFTSRKGKAHYMHRFIIL